MHPLIRFSYEAAGRVTRVAVAVAPRGNSKILRALSSRRGLLGRYRAWASTGRDRSRPLLWVHAPSVGEGLQARPVVQAFRKKRPDAQIVYTFYSPSAERFAASTGADFFDYLPFDNERDTAEALDVISPTAVVFSKLDVWPMFVAGAAKRGVKTALLSATVPESSRRRSGVALMALREAYEALDVVGAISPSDAERLLAMGVRGDRMTVTGDTRYDQVWERANAPNESRDEIVKRYRDSRPTLVAGSTWPSDEKRLFPAWVQARRQLPGARLIIAPHELHKKHLASIEKWARESSLTLSRTSEPEARATEVILVDQYGILADMYAVADAAYVGGGFHSDGLHSLLEPASLGAPVLMGPMHMDNRDAGLLVGGGGGMRCFGPGDISARLLAWFRSPQVLARASASARRVVEAGVGAGERSTELVESLFDRSDDTIGRSTLKNERDM